MKFFILVSAFCLLTSPVAHGQWLETTILLPDSLGDVRYPDRVLYVPSHNTLYVGSHAFDAMVVFDCSTNRKVARMSVSGGVSNMVYNGHEDKLYVSSSRARIYVIDAAADQVIDSLSSPPSQSLMALDPVRNRLYTAAEEQGVVSSIDCASDSVLKRVAVGNVLTSLCCDSSGNRLYCADAEAEGVKVYDCRTDTVVKTIWTGTGPFNLLFNPLNNRIYCSDNGDGDVALIDPARDTVLKFISTDSDPYELCLNPRANTIFVTGHDAGAMAVISGVSDLVIAHPAVGSGPSGMVYDSVLNRVFCANLESNDLAVVDGSNNGTIGFIPVGGMVSRMCSNPGLHRIYEADGDNVGVVDCDSGRLAARLLNHFVPGPMCVNPALNKVYCAGDQMSGLAVIDGATSHVNRVVPTDTSWHNLACAPEVNKVYCSNPLSPGHRLQVFDSQGDSLTKSIRMPEAVGPLLYNPNGPEVYCAGLYGDYTYVIDCVRDSMVDCFRLPAPMLTWALDGEHSRVFALVGDDKLYAVDAGPDTVAGSVVIGNDYEYLSVAPNHRYVFATGRYDSAVVVVDEASMSIIARINIGGRPGRTLYNGRRDKLYCISSVGLMILDCASFQVTGPISGVPEPREIVLDTIADRLYCSSVGGFISVVDGARDSVLRWVNLTEFSGPMVWNPAGRRVYVVAGAQSAIFVLRDTVVTGMAEQPQAPNLKQQAVPTVIRNILNLPASPCPRVTASLLDASGRRVVPLHPGPNDVRHLAPGVYFVHQASGGERKASVVTKVLLMR